MKREYYDAYMEICFEVRGSGFNPRSPSVVERVNEELRAFRQKLEALKVEEGPLVARVERVDEFNSELKDFSNILCSQKLYWAIVDSGPGWADRKNNHLQPLLHKRVRALTHDNGQPFSDRIEIRVVDSVFPGEPKTGPWPPEKVTTVTVLG